MIAGLAVFALGALSVAGDYRAAAAGGAALATILASREVLHGLLKRLTWVELRSVPILAVMTAIVLPLLPNGTMDPWGGLNPWEVCFLTVLMASISFTGYLAVRIPGNTRGLLVSSLAALAADAIGRLALAVFAGPVRFWLPLAVATSIAATMGICALLLLDPGMEARAFFDADQGQGPAAALWNAFKGDRHDQFEGPHPKFPQCPAAARSRERSSRR